MYFFVLFEMLYNVEKEKETQTSHKSRASYQDEGNDSDAIVHKLTWHISHPSHHQQYR